MAIIIHDYYDTVKYLYYVILYLIMCVHLCSCLGAAAGNQLGEQVTVSSFSKNKLIEFFKEKGLKYKS